MKGSELFQRLQCSSGKVVLHGSPHELSLLEPKKSAIQSANPEHTECAVYASPYAPIALLYALIHESRDVWGWRANFSESPELLVVGPNPLKGGKGYLYVLPPDPFTKIIGDGICCASYEPVRPLDVLEVDPSVLEYLQKYFCLRFKLPSVT